MAEGRLETAGGSRLAYASVEGRGPTVLWLGGFASDMSGSKASALADWARAKGRRFVRFDYSGHGLSSGAFCDGDVGLWRSDAFAVADALCRPPLLLVGSSMGAWIALHLALARPALVMGLVLIAPAVDFTERLLEPALPPDARAEIDRTGRWIRPSELDGAGTVITRRLIEDGRRWSLLGRPLPIAAPVRILHGGKDQEVPLAHALSVYEAIDAADVHLTLIKDGDHRLSRPKDLEDVLAVVEKLAATAPVPRSASPA